MASYKADKYRILHQKWPAIHLWNRDDLRVDHRDLVCGIENWESGIGSWCWSLIPPPSPLLNVMCATLPLHTTQLAVAGIAFNKFLPEAISSNTGPDTLLASYLHTPRQEWTWLISQGFSHLWFWTDPSHKWMTAIRNLKVTTTTFSLNFLAKHIWGQTFTRWMIKQQFLAVNLEVNCVFVVSKKEFVLGPDTNWYRVRHNATILAMINFSKERFNGSFN